MTVSSSESVSAGEVAREAETPGWFFAVFLFGVVSLVFHFGSIWSWWALLWAPAFVGAVGITAYEWRLVARKGWRMPVGEWALLVAAHAGCAASLAGILGLVHF